MKYVTIVNNNQFDPTFDVGSGVLRSVFNSDNPERDYHEYNRYFHLCLNPDHSPAGFLESLDEIIRTAVQEHRLGSRKISLGCSCGKGDYCHAHIIAKYVNMIVSQELEKSPQEEYESTAYRTPEHIDDKFLAVSAALPDSLEDTWADILQYIYRLETSHQVMLETYQGFKNLIEQQYPVEEQRSGGCCGQCH